MRAVKLAGATLIVAATLLQGAGGRASRSIEDGSSALAGLGPVEITSRELLAALPEHRRQKPDMQDAVVRRLVEDLLIEGSVELECDETNASPDRRPMLFVDLHVASEPGKEGEEGRQFTFYVRLHLRERARLVRSGLPVTVTTWGPPSSAVQSSKMYDSLDECWDASLAEVRRQVEAFIADYRAANPDAGFDRP